jgi:hypothetical protein
VPWVPPGAYTVKLTVDGKTTTQPIVVHLDPRVTIAPLVLTELNSLSSGLYWDAVAAHRAFNDARALAKTLETKAGAEAAALKRELDVLAPANVQRNVRQLRRRNDPAGVVTRGREQCAASGSLVDSGGRGRADGGADRRSDRGRGPGEAGDGAVGSGAGEGQSVEAIASTRAGPFDSGGSESGREPSGEQRDRARGFSGRSCHLQANIRTVRRTH